MACAAPVSHTLVYNTSLSTPQPGAKMASIPVFIFYHFYFTQLCLIGRSPVLVVLQWHIFTMCLAVPHCVLLRVGDNLNILLRFGKLGILCKHKWPEIGLISHP